MRNIPVIIPYLGKEEKEAVWETIQSGWVGQGPKVGEFEKAVSSYEGCKYGVAVTSCTTALHLALVAMGIDKNCDCITPSFTFIATPNSIAYTGATPIFVDVDPRTYNIDITSLEKVIEEKYNYIDGTLINKETKKVLKLILPVNLFGLCADILKVNKIAKKYNLQVLEDSACAFGSKIGNTFESNFGNPTCLSFHPRKSITTGEGGMILTNDEGIFKRANMLRSHGASISEVERHKQHGFLLPDFDNLGYNYRMTDIQAAMGIAQMKKMDFITNTRRQKADFYTKLITENDIKFIKSPYVPENYYHTYQSYVCMIDIEGLGVKTIEEASEFRYKLMLSLESKGIATRVGTHATHMLGYYKNKFGFSDKDFMGSYMVDKLSITLPLYVQMTDDDQKYVIDEIIKSKNEILGE